MAGTSIPVYVLMSRDLVRPAQVLVEVSLVDLPDVIDFGIQGLQVTATQFVGVRYVGPGVVVDTPKSASNHAVSDVLKGILGSRKAAPQDKELTVSHGESKPPVTEVVSDYHDKLSNGLKWIQTIAHPRNGDSRSPMEHYQNEGNKGSPKKDDYGLSAKIFCGARLSQIHLFHEMGFHTWELVWKQGKAGGPLRRLKFVTMEAGYRLVQDKLDAWASAAHTSVAMNQAAEAALDACGGHLKENPMHDDVHPEIFLPGKRSHGEATEQTDQLDNNHSEREADQADETHHQDLHVIKLQSIQLQGRLQPLCDSRSQILQDGQIMALAAVLPVRFRSYKWTLLYSSDRDGTSLSTMFRKGHMNGPSILVVRDLQKYVFGCYASEEWKVAARSYGTGECFVFQIVPDMKAYKWTRGNSMFMFSNGDTLAMGGGTNYSIMVDSDLLTGYSGACETFGSPSLSSSEEFSVSKVELWGFY